MLGGARASVRGSAHTHRPATTGHVLHGRRQSQTFISAAEQWAAAMLFWEGCLATAASARSHVSSLRLPGTLGSTGRVDQGGGARPRQLRDPDQMWNLLDAYTRPDGSGSYSVMTTETDRPAAASELVEPVSPACVRACVHTHNKNNQHEKKKTLRKSSASYYWNIKGPF